ncbi:MAG: glycosyltransferase family 2 protein [Syntrophomonadaceae bacterium]|nr:glycosyltransferase family 2 protein [Syntrophomonadaceae bacterium]
MVSQKNPKVQVILSTYNGEKYLRELLNSLLAQVYPNTNILIRDDGSKDGTTDILHVYKDLPNIEIIFGENIGAINSFFELLKMVAEDTDYIAFCDQDDVWMKDKVSRAVFDLEKKVPCQIPGMCFSRYAIVDENLQVLGYSEIPKRGPSFENALVQNIATGCTVMINKQARLRIIEELPREVRMHDWWIYQVVSALGIVIYDPVPSILYRQHSSNIVGAKASSWGKWMNRLKRFAKRGRLPLVTEQAREFMRLYGDQLAGDKKEILEDFVLGRDRFLKRVGYAVLRCRVHRQTFLENMVLRVLLVLNRV